MMDMALHEEQSQREVETKLQRSFPKSRRSVDSNSSLFKTKRKISKKDPKKHQLIFLDGGLPDGTELAYFSRGRELLKGIKQGRGIFCSCCKTEVSPSQFEAHAGNAFRRKPYENIFLVNGPVNRPVYGPSLREYASELKRSFEQLEKKNDPLYCQKGGDQLVCVGCRRSLHRECKYETRIPFKKRLCINCRKPVKCVGRNSNAVAGEQIVKRIQIVEKPDKNYLVACVLCRAYDFCETGFNDRTVIICEQCEKEYHIGCLKEYNKARLKELPRGNWFCTVGCKRLYSDLNALATCGPRKVSDSDLEWILLRGKCASRENKLLLDEAVKIFHECFNRIPAPGTGKDIISSMAYGKKVRPSDFSGVHCAMLTINSKVVTAGLFRLFGHKVAELPIVATSQPNQGILSIVLGLL